MAASVGRNVNDFNPPPQSGGGGGGQSARDSAIGDAPTSVLQMIPGWPAIHHVCILQYTSAPVKPIRQLRFRLPNAPHAPRLVARQADGHGGPVGAFDDQPQVAAEGADVAAQGRNQGVLAPLQLGDPILGGSQGGCDLRLGALHRLADLAQGNLADKLAGARLARPPHGPPVGARSNPRHRRCDRSYQRLQMSVETSIGPLDAVPVEAAGSHAGLF